MLVESAMAMERAVSIAPVFNMEPVSMICAGCAMATVRIVSIATVCRLARVNSTPAVFAMEPTTHAKIVLDRRLVRWSMTGVACVVEMASRVSIVLVVCLAMPLWMIVVCAVEKVALALIAAAPSMEARQSTSVACVSMCEAKATDPSVLIAPAKPTALRSATSVAHVLLRCAVILAISRFVDYCFAFGGCGG